MRFDGVARIIQYSTSSEHGFDTQAQSRAAYLPRPARSPSLAPLAPAPRMGLSFLVLAADAAVHIAANCAAHLPVTVQARGRDVHPLHTSYLPAANLQSRSEKAALLPASARHRYVHHMRPWPLLQGPLQSIKKTRRLVGKLATKCKKMFFCSEPRPSPSLTLRLNTRSKNCLGGVLLAAWSGCSMSAFCLFMRAWMDGMKKHRAQIAGTSIRHAAAGSICPQRQSSSRALVEIEYAVD